MRTVALVLLVGLGGLPSEADAQSISVSQSPVYIAVPFGPNGFGVGADESSELTWRGSNRSIAKITVHTEIASQRFSLSVEAVVRDRDGTSTGPVPLTAGMSPRDLVVDIDSPARRRAPLRYEATAQATAAGGSDTHTVVYTISQQ